MKIVEATKNQNVEATVLTAGDLNGLPSEITRACVRIESEVEQAVGADSR